MLNTAALQQSSAARTRRADLNADSNQDVHYTHRRKMRFYRHYSLI